MPIMISTAVLNISQQTQAVDCDYFSLMNPTSFPYHIYHHYPIVDGIEPMPIM